MIYCYTCGHCQSEENTFCARCGVKLLKPENIPQVPPVPVQSPQDRTPAPTSEVPEQAVPETVPEAAPEISPEAVPETIPEAVPEISPEAVPEIPPEAPPAKRSKKWLFLLLYAVSFLAVMAGLLFITRIWPSDQTPTQGTYVLPQDGPSDDPCKFLTDDTVLGRNIADVTDTLVPNEDFFPEYYEDYYEYTFYPNATYLGVPTENFSVDLDVDPNTMEVYEAFYNFALEEDTAFDRFDEMVDALVAKHGPYSCCYRILEDGTEVPITRAELMQALRRGESAMFSVDWDMTVVTKEASFLSPEEREGRYMYILLDTNDYEDPTDNGYTLLSAADSDDGYIYGWTGIR